MKATGPHQPAEFSGLYELGMYFFVFTQARFMAQNVIYSGEGSICTWEKGEIDCLGVKCPIGINQV